MTEPARRPYKTVSLAEEGGQFCLLLDGKPARTPLRHAIETASRALADEIVAEWDRQGAAIDMHAMPMTRLLATAIDRVAPGREALLAELLRHIDSDALCYFAEAPESLRTRQTLAWQPVLDWLASAHGIALVPTRGIMPQRQSPTVAAAMEAAIRALSRDRFNAFQVCAGACGSLALALAFVHGRLNADEVFAAAFLDETYQMEHWGTDAQAQARRYAIARDIAAAEKYLRLTEPSKGASA